MWSNARHDKADSFMFTLKFNAMPGVFFMYVYERLCSASSSVMLSVLGKMSRFV